MVQETFGQADKAGHPEPERCIARVLRGHEAVACLLFWARKGCEKVSVPWNTQLLRYELVRRATDKEISKVWVGFCDPDEALRIELTLAMRTPKNWRRIYKRRNSVGIERAFDCDPLDAQLRAYVTTDYADTNILEVRFETE